MEHVLLYSKNQKLVGSVFLVNANQKDYALKQIRVQECDLRIYHWTWGVDACEESSREFAINKYLNEKSSNEEQEYYIVMKGMDEDKWRVDHFYTIREENQKKTFWNNIVSI